MKEIALEFINIIEKNSFVAYIVGGFVRDHLMDLESKDVDITTNATPKEIKKIFKDVSFPKHMNDDDNYGSVRVNYKNILFEVTTFRKELEYLDNRHPSSIIYVNDLETDLKRRDFTINAICLNKNGEVIDLLNGTTDLQNKIIKTIGNSKTSFQDDALRILRAIRFMTTLKFNLSNEVKLAILECKHLLKNISYERKKQELDKIFGGQDAKYGIEVIKELDLVDCLDLENLDRIKDYTDLIGIWSMINSKHYKFTKHEKELINKVNLVYELDNLNPLVLYKYGLYVNILAGINKNLTKKEITETYNKLPIKTKKDIQITAKEICSLLNRKPDSFINDIYNILEIELLNGNLINENRYIIEFIKKKFSKITN